MALNKVEICGVNTSKLPLLNNEEKEALLRVLRRAIRKQGSFTLRGI